MPRAIAKSFSHDIFGYIIPNCMLCFFHQILLDKLQSLSFLVKTCDNLWSHRVCSDWYAVNSCSREPLNLVAFLRPFKIHDYSFERHLRPMPRTKNPSPSRTQTGKPTTVSKDKYRHVMAVHSQPRTSCLSHDSTASPSFLGFRNLMVLVLSTYLLTMLFATYVGSSSLAYLVVMNLRLVIENFIKVSQPTLYPVAELISAVWRLDLHKMSRLPAAGCTTRSWSLCPRSMPSLRRPHN